jgi:flavin reductase (DIM6/NTAB) family NADH-FMN oxidoreductase RutF
MNTDELAASAPETREEARNWVTPTAFKSIFRRHPAGVAVITFRSGDRLVGFTATSVISVSADPPVLVFSIDSGSSSFRALVDAKTLVINFLAASQVDLSARFATAGIDRFADGGWSELPTGEAVLDDSPAWLRGEIIQRTPVGRSFLIAVLVLESHQAGTADPLVYHDRTYHAVGDETAI